jgi:hypothetical protein
MISRRVVLAFLALLVPAVSAAQEPATPNQEIRATVRRHIKQIYFTPLWTISNFGVDSNVFHTSTDTKSDFTATLQPRIKAWVPVASRLQVSADAALDMVYYKTFASERSLDPGVTVRGDFFLHRIGLFAQDSYLATRQRPNFEIDARSRRIEKEAVAGINLQFTPKSNADFAYYESSFRYDRDQVFADTTLSTTLNRREHGIRFTGRHALTAKTMVLLTAETTNWTFDFSPNRNAGGFKIAPSVRFAPRALISGQAEVGYRRLTSPTDALPSYSGPVMSGDLSYRLLGATRLTIIGSRDLNYSFEIDHPYYVVDRVGGRIRRQIGGRFDSILGLDRSAYAYRNFTGAAPSQREDVTRNLSLDLGYRLGSGMRVGFVASRWARRSNELAVRDSRWYTFGFSLTVEQ